MAGGGGDAAGSPWLAAVLVAAASLCFSLMSLCVKLSAAHDDTSPFSLLAVRMGIGLVLNSLAALGHKSIVAVAGSGFHAHPQPGEDPAALRSRRERHGCPTTPRACWWLALRCICGAASVILEFFALRNLPLSIATMILYTSPAWIVVWAAVIFRESIKPAAVACIAVSFGGLLLVVQPWNQMSQVGPLSAYAAALAMAMLAGLVYVSLRELRGVRYHVVLNFFQGTSLVLGLVLGAALHRLPLPPFPSKSWGYLVGVGAAAYAAEVCVTVGFAEAGRSLGHVSVLKFLSPIFSTLWGVFYLGERLSPLQIVGCALVMGASATILYLKSAASADHAGNAHTPAGKSDSEDEQPGESSTSDGENEADETSSSEVSVEDTDAERGARGP